MAGLSPAEVLVTARNAAPDGTVTNRSTQVEVDLPPAEVKYRPDGLVTSTTTEDRPSVLVELPGGSVEFSVDRLFDAWIAQLHAGERGERQLVAGAGDVMRAIEWLREMLGLPAPARQAQPSHLTFGGQP